MYIYTFTTKYRKKGFKFCKWLWVTKEFVNIPISYGLNVFDNLLLLSYTHLYHNISILLPRNISKLNDKCKIYSQDAMKGIKTDSFYILILKYNL